MLFKFSFTRILTLFLVVNLSNCFEVVHYIQKLENDTFRIQWSFAISSAFTKQDPNQPTPPKENLKDKIKNSETELNEKLKEYVNNFQYSIIENEYETGIRISFDIKNLNNVPKIDGLAEEGLPMIPRWRRDKNQLIFQFSNKDKNQNTDSKTESTENEQIKSEDGDPTQKIVSMIMSSATYRLILGNNLSPKKIFVQSMSTKKIQNLEAIDYGGQTHIRIPFMSLLNEDKKGFFLVVQL